MWSRSSLESLYHSKFNSSDETLVFNQDSEMVITSNLLLLFSSLSWVKCSEFRSERIFRWRTLSLCECWIRSESIISGGWTGDLALFTFRRSNDLRLCKFEPTWLNLESFLGITITCGDIENLVSEWNSGTASHAFEDVLVLKQT